MIRVAQISNPHWESTAECDLQVHHPHHCAWQVYTHDAAAADDDDDDDDDDGCSDADDD